MKARFTDHRLDSDARPSRLYEYYVSGRGQFPFDMLRYDACWPATSEDAAKLEEDETSLRHVRSIKMRSYKEPTLGRWSSFLWSAGTEKL